MTSFPIKQRMQLTVLQVGRAQAVTFFLKLCSISHSWLSCSSRAAFTTSCFLWILYLQSSSPLFFSKATLRQRKKLLWQIVMFKLKATTAQNLVINNNFLFFFLQNTMLPQNTNDDSNDDACCSMRSYIPAVMQAVEGLDATEYQNNWFSGNFPNADIILRASGKALRGTSIAYFVTFICMKRKSACSPCFEGTSHKTTVGTFDPWQPLYMKGCLGVSVS